MLLLFLLSKQTLTCIRFHSLTFLCCKVFTLESVSFYPPLCSPVVRALAGKQVLSTLLEIHEGVPKVKKSVRVLKENMKKMMDSL
jgi:hypothetical protein